MKIAIDQSKLVEYIYIDLEEVIPESEDTFTFRFAPVGAFHWNAGANAHLVSREMKTLSVEDKQWRRHMSIMSTKDEGYIGFTTRIREPRSPFKTSLINSRPGDRLRIYGIKNNFPLERQDRPVVLLSMGVGMATMRPLIREYVHDPRGVSKLISLNVDRAEPGVYQAEMDALDAPGFSQEYLKSRRDFLSRVDECLHVQDALYYLVGSDAFLSGTSAYLVGSGVSREQIRIDKKPHKVQAILEGI